jgi:phosphoglycolate phosphatase-like HAD superfamily hydrolase
MLRAVILDMDGTLLDTEIVHYYVIRRILARELGYDPSMTEYLKYCGIPDPVMWPMILEELDSSSVLSLAQKWGKLRNLSPIFGRNANCFFRVFMIIFTRKSMYMGYCPNTK